MHPTNQKILVLDLDETLVRAVAKGDKQKKFDKDTDLKNIKEINIDINGHRVPMLIALRPGVANFLTTLSKNYTLVVYTLGLEEYAEAILEELDPFGTIFSLVLHRDHNVVIK